MSEVNYKSSLFLYIFYDHYKPYYGPRIYRLMICINKIILLFSYYGCIDRYVITSRNWIITSSQIIVSNFFL